MPTEKEGLNIMKKFVTLLLVAVMCLSLVACGGESETTKTSNDNITEKDNTNQSSKKETSGKDAIIGEWKATDGTAFVFEKGGTAQFNGKEITWKYDKELKCYVLPLKVTMSVNIEIEDDIRFFQIMDTRYYDIDDYEKGAELEKQVVMEEFNGYTEGKTKIEVGKSYDLGNGIMFEFLSASIMDNNDVCINATFTSESLYNVGMLLGEVYRYDTYCVYDDFYVSNSGSVMVWEDKDGKLLDIDGSGTVERVLTVYEAENDYHASLDRIIAMICCVEFGETEYYMDLSEYLK